MEAFSRSWAERSSACAWSNSATASSGVTIPSAASVAAYCSRTVGCAAIWATISGCVYAASSCSLWPKRR